MFAHKPAAIKARNNFVVLSVIASSPVHISGYGLLKLIRRLVYASIQDMKRPFAILRYGNNDLSPTSTARAWSTRDF